MSKQNDAVAVVESIERLLGKLKGLLIQVVHETVENAMVAEVARLPKKATVPTEGEQSPAKPKTRAKAPAKKEQSEVTETNGKHEEKRKPGRPVVKYPHGLRPRQIKVLAFLATQRKAVTKEVLAEGAGEAWERFRWYTMGIKDATKLAEQEQKWGKTLLTHKFVTIERVDIDGKDVDLIQITSEGRQALRECKAQEAKKTK